MDQPFDPSLLTTFLAAIDQRTISGAARAEHLSQPAVTGRIQRLEDALRTPLLVRSVHGVSATPAGERLARCARDIQLTLQQAADDIAALSGADQPAGPLDLMVSTTVAAHVLPPVLARFRQRHPDITWKLRIGNTDDVVAAVRDGEVGLGLVEGLTRASRVRLEPWLDDELVPVVGAQSAWRPRRIEDLAGIPILWREPGSGTRAVVSKALRAAGQRHRPGPLDVELGTSEAIASGAAAGLGLAFLSRWALGPHLASGRLRTVPALGLTVRRVFSWALPTRAPAGTAGMFLAFGRRHPPTPA